MAAQLAELGERLAAALGDAMVGLYLHGSLAMGCFNPLTSDVDLLVVVGRELNAAEREQVGEHLVDADRRYANPVELSVVTTAAMRPLRHPAAYEFHFGRDRVERFRAGRVDFTRGGTDPDLAAHVTVALARGVALLGPPVADVFGAVPRAAYLDSIIGDHHWSAELIMAGPDTGTTVVPPYGVLNAGRVLAAASDGAILSKAESASWLVPRLPARLRPIIEAAEGTYRDGRPRDVSAALLKDYVRHLSRELTAAGVTASFATPETSAAPE